VSAPRTTTAAQALDATATNAAEMATAERAMAETLILDRGYAEVWDPRAQQVVRVTSLDAWDALAAAIARRPRRVRRPAQEPAPCPAACP
jgi:hypothetical protein